MSSEVIGPGVEDGSSPALSCLTRRRSPPPPGGDAPRSPGLLPTVPRSAGLLSPRLAVCLTKVIVLPLVKDYFSNVKQQFLSIHSCINYSPNKGLYCTKQAYSHLLFCELLHGMKSSIMGCVSIFSDFVDSKVHIVVRAL